MSDAFPARTLVDRLHGTTCRFVRHDWLMVWRTPDLTHDITCRRCRVRYADLPAGTPVGVVVMQLMAAAQDAAAVREAKELAESWRYKGEFGWDDGSHAYGPDPEGYFLDIASSELHRVLRRSHV